jgi:hypothetical protein
LERYPTSPTASSEEDWGDNAGVEDDLRAPTTLEKRAEEASSDGVNAIIV